MGKRALFGRKSRSSSGYEEPDSITHHLSFSAKRQVVVDSRLSQPASDELS